MAKQNINVGSSANDRSGDSLRSAFQKINLNFTELYTALGLNADTNLNIGAFEFTGSTMSTTDSSSITIDQATTVSSNLTVGGDLLPSVANGGDLGSAAKPWRSLYVSGSTIYLGNHTLGINNQGELTFNNNRVAHENGEFMTLDNLSDLNVNSPNAGDTIAWMGSQWVNVPLYEDKLHSEGDEVVLVGGANPYVTFPAITGGDQLVIQGGEVTASSGNLALTGQSTVTVISNAAGVGGGSNYFTFGADGSLMFPDGSLALTDSVLNNGLDADLKGSVFGDDSSVMVNAIDRTLHSVSVNTLQLNFNISGDNIVAPTGGYITIGHSDGAGGVNNVATFDAGGIVFDQDVNMGVGKQIKSANGDNLELVSATNMGDYTWTFNASGGLLFPAIPTGGGGYEQIVIGGAEVMAQDSLLLIESFNDLVRIVANAQGPAKNWTFDTAGDLTLPGNLQSNGNINIEINLTDSTKRIWRFGEDGVLNVPGAIQLANGAQIFNTAGIDDSITIGATGTPGTTTFNGSGFFNGDTFFHRSIQEKFSSLQDATGVVTHNCANGHIFYHTSPDANWTVNLTNFSLITNYATAITIIISQGGTGYYPNALQIGGAAQTINWQGNTTPTPSTNRVDVVTFSIFLTGGGYTVLGQLTGF